MRKDTFLTSSSLGSRTVVLAIFALTVLCHQTISLVIYVTDLSRPYPPKIFREVRDLKAIETCQLRDCVRETQLEGPKRDEISSEELAEQFHTKMRQVLDIVAPAKVKVIKDKNRASWFEASHRESRASLRVLEKEWILDRLEVKRQIFISARKNYHHQLEEARTNHLHARIERADQRQLFGIVDELTGDKKTLSSTLPEYSSPRDLADKFVRYFHEKIEKLRESFHETRPETEKELSANYFTYFTPVTKESLSKLILTMNSKSCDLDPIPTDLLKVVLPEVIEELVILVNCQFDTASFPKLYKKAIVRPLLKKQGLDIENMKNYRPVSNLSFEHKFIERVVFNQIDIYLQQFSLYSKFQSAYRSNHSCETALLRVRNDVLLALDIHKEVILVLLDLSSAFDTIDFSLLFYRLEHRFGFKGPALAWFKSYFQDRTQRVAIGNVMSEEIALECGVPQGSVLGPLLFTLHLSPLEDVIMEHGMDVMCFADDTQIYLACDNAVKDAFKMETCIDEVRSWMITNRLILNDSKTEVLHFRSRFKSSDFLSSIRVGVTHVKTSESVRDLGAHFDDFTSMSVHVSNVCRTASYSLYRIGRIRRFLDRSRTETLVHAFVTSRLDYCNSLLFGIDDQHLHRLQSLQNTAARIVTRTRKFEHITPVLRSLHWLPVKLRIHFKVLIFVWKVLHDQAPLYLSSLLELQSPPPLGSTGVAVRTRQRVRVAKEISEGALLLETRSFKQKTFGARSFTYYAPVLWNALPTEIRSAPSLDCFKSLLKTHLFCLHYND